MGKYPRWLIPLLLLTALAAWMAMPNHPGIHLRLGSLTLDRNLDYKLGLDLLGGVQALLESEIPCDQVDPQAMETARVIVERRVNGLGVSEAVVQLAENCRIVVEIPGERDPERALNTVRQTGLLEFVALGTTYLPPGTSIQTDFGLTAAEAAPTPTPEATATPAAEAQPTPAAQPTQVYHTVMTGTALKSVAVVTNQVGEYEIAFTLTDEGARIFREFTTQHTGEYLAIVLDKQVISAPRIREPITDGQGVITGNFTYETANELAVQMRYGALPIPLRVAESRTIGPTLGEDSLRKSLVAGFIGLGVVALFMVLYYRLPGAIAVLALFTYTVLSLTIFKLIPVTLTLPGIAGFVLSIGMAVDANILIFERMKEELRAGRPLIHAIDLGWRRAWPSIRDANISTLITTAILYWFGNAYGASLVKGFALTLALGVLVSMFTAIAVTRVYLHTVLDNVQVAEHPRWFGL